MSVTFRGKPLIPSKYLEAADLQGKRVAVTIEAIQFVDMPPRKTGDRAERRPLFILRDKEKGWVLNRTNLNAIASVYGAEAEKWIGKTVIIYAAKVQAFGEIKAAVRVDIDATEERAKHTAKNGNGKSKQQAEPAHDPATGEVLDAPPAGEEFDYGPPPMTDEESAAMGEQ